MRIWDSIKNLLPGASTHDRGHPLQRGRDQDDAFVTDGASRQLRDGPGAVRPQDGQSERQPAPPPRMVVDVANRSVQQRRADLLERFASQAETLDGGCGRGKR